MTVIGTPELNTYGPYARASLLADYIEVLALKGQPVKHTTVADFLADNGWKLQHLNLIQSPENDEPDEESTILADQLDEAQEAASIAFRQIEERRDVLEGRIPSRLRTMWSHSVPASTSRRALRRSARPDRRACIRGELGASAGGRVRAHCGKGVAGARIVDGRAGCSSSRRQYLRGGTEHRLRGGWSQGGAAAGGETSIGSRRRGGRPLPPGLGEGPAAGYVGVHRPGHGGQKR